MVIEQEDMLFLNIILYVIHQFVPFMSIALSHKFIQHAIQCFFKVPMQETIDERAFIFEGAQKRKMDIAVCLYCRLPLHLLRSLPVPHGTQQPIVR